MQYFPAIQHFCSAGAFRGTLVLVFAEYVTLSSADFDARLVAFAFLTLDADDGLIQAVNAILVERLFDQVCGDSIRFIGGHFTRLRDESSALVAAFLLDILAGLFGARNERIGIVG